eukprot:5147046-Ditylum_brightwellii.AAC.1
MTMTDAKCAKNQEADDVAALNEDNNSSSGGSSSSSGTRSSMNSRRFGKPSGYSADCSSVSTESSDSSSKGSG